MKEGDRVRVGKGPHGGIVGTVINTRGLKIYRRGRLKYDEPVRVPVITIKTGINRFIKEAENNLSLV